MDVVDQIRWIPGFGYERELDWLRTMADWMISKKRYWGLALPIWECARLRRFDVIGGREELQAARGRGLGGVRGPHAAPAVRRRGEDRVLGVRRRSRERIPDVGNPWLDAGIVPFSTLHYREDPDYWRAVVPGRLHHRVVPGPVPQLVLLDAGDEHGAAPRAPFKTIFGYATLFGEDGRPMHKSWGNAIEFNEARRAHGRRRDALDVRPAAARGQHPLRLPRRRRGAPRAARAVERLRLLRDLRPAGRLDAGARSASGRSQPPTARTPLDRWILSRAAGLAAERARPSWPTSMRAPPRWPIGALHRRPLAPGTCAAAGGASRAATTRADRDAAFAHAPPGARERWRACCAPILPFLAEELYQVLVRSGVGDGRARLGAPDALAGCASSRRCATTALEAAMADAAARGRAGSDAARRRPASRSASRSPRLWLALPGGALGGGLAADDAAALLELLADELNVKAVRAHRRRVGAGGAARQAAAAGDRRKHGRAVPAIMAAARANEVEYPGRTAASTLGGVDAGAGRGRDPGHAAARARPSRTTRASWWSSTRR